MSLLSILRTGVSIIDKVTKPLQPSVIFTRTATIDGAGVVTPFTAVSLKAIVDWRQQKVRTMSGEMSVCRALVIFLDVAALSKATNGLGISVEDKIILPDGTTKPILNMSGFIDAGTGKPVATEVYIG